MFAPGFAFYHNIIDINLYVPVDQGFEYLCHQSLVSDASILEPKWHNLVAIQIVGRHEGCILLVWWDHGDLVVSGECIYEGEHSVSSSGIHYLIYLGQRKTILQVSIIQIGVVNTNSPFSIFLWNNHHVR